jgi:ABC-type antimicrobial peptide transport system permease subunit
MILRQGVRVALIGCLLGLGGAMVLGNVISGFLFQTAPADPVVLTAIGLLLIGAATLASYLPARRATRVDPMAALREH